MRAVRGGGAGSMRSRSTTRFFALGGDSIMSIQLVSRARKAGLMITPRAVFQHQTVAALAGGRQLVTRPPPRCPTSPPAPCRRHRSCAGWRSTRSDRALQPGDAAAGAGGAAGGASGCGAAGVAGSSRCAAAAADRTAGKGAWSLEVAPAGAVRRPSVPAAGRHRRPRPRRRGARASRAQAEAAERRLAPAAGVMVQAVWFDAGAEDEPVGCC